MTDDIGKKAEGSPMELIGEELEKVAGGAGIDSVPMAKCTQCDWYRLFATLDMARAAATEHRNATGHVVKWGYAAG